MSLSLNNLQVLSLIKVDSLLARTYVSERRILGQAPSNARGFRGRDDIQSTTCNKGSDQGLRRLHGTSPVNSRGAPGRGLRTAGAQRIGKDHDTTASAGALASDVRTGDDLRTGLLASKSAGPPPGLLSSRRAPDVWFDVGTGAAPFSLRPA